MLKNLVNWGNSCKLRFNPEKTVAVLFTRKRKVPDNVIKFENKIIPFSETVKYLGVTLDAKLHWKEHIDVKIKASKRLIMAISNITYKASGPCPRLMRWAMEGMVKPMLSYGALVWAHEINTEVLIKKFRKINRLAINTFSLVPRSTPTRLLEVILDVMPLHLWCREIAVKTYFRLYKMLDLKWSGTYKNKTYSTSHLRYWRSIQVSLNMSPDETDSCKEKSVDLLFKVNTNFLNQKDPVHSELNVYTDCLLYTSPSPRD